MIPLSTTTISVLRRAADAYRDDLDAQPTPTVLASGVRAQISSPSGSENVVGGDRERVTFRMVCDPVDLTNLDQVKDESTDDVYEVQWARARTGLGLDHVVAGLLQVTGEAT